MATFVGDSAALSVSRYLHLRVQCGKSPLVLPAVLLGNRSSLGYGWCVPTRSAAMFGTRDAGFITASVGWRDSINGPHGWAHRA
jgi:hypothetical protein